MTASVKEEPPDSLRSTGTERSRPSAIDPGGRKGTLEPAWLAGTKPKTSACESSDAPSPLVAQLVDVKEEPPDVKHQEKFSVQEVKDDPPDSMGSVEPECDRIKSRSTLLSPHSPRSADPGGESDRIPSLWMRMHSHRPVDPGGKNRLNHLVSTRLECWTPGVMKTLGVTGISPSPVEQARGPEHNCVLGTALFDPRASDSTPTSSHERSRTWDAVLQPRPQLTGIYKCSVFAGFTSSTIGWLLPSEGVHANVLGYPLQQPFLSPTVSPFAGEGWQSRYQRIALGCGRVCMPSHLSLTQPWAPDHSSSRDGTSSLSPQSLSAGACGEPCLTRCPGMCAVRYTQCAAQMQH